MTKRNQTSPTEAPQQGLLSMDEREDLIRKLTRKDWFDKYVENFKPKKRKRKKRLKTKHDLFIDKIREKASKIPDGYIGGTM